MKLTISTKNEARCWGEAGKSCSLCRIVVNHDYTPCVKIWREGGREEGENPSKVSLGNHLNTGKMNISSLEV